MSHPGELFGSRASRASLSSTTQSCFTAGDRICNVNVTLVYHLLTNHYPSTHAPTSMYYTVYALPTHRPITNLEGQSFCLVLPPDRELETALVQPGHLVVLLPDAPLDLLHDRRHAVACEAGVGAAQASHLDGMKGQYLDEGLDGSRDGCSVLTIELILETTSKSCMRSLMSWARFSAICLSTLLLAVVVVAEFVFVRLACNTDIPSIQVANIQIFDIQYQNNAHQTIKI